MLYFESFCYCSLAVDSVASFLSARQFIWFTSFTIDLSDFARIYLTINRYFKRIESSYVYSKQNTSWKVCPYGIYALVG